MNRDAISNEGGHAKSRTAEAWKIIVFNYYSICAYYDGGTTENSDLLPI